jgi:AcrR family transcriptional regulator
VTQRGFTVQASVGRERRAATRQQVLDALRRLLEEGAPLSGLSVERIVSEAGVSRATFYVHFSGKAELVTALSDQDMEPWLAHALPVLADPTADREAFDRVVRELVANWRRHAAVTAGLVELAEYDEAVREAWNGMVERMAHHLAEHLRLRWDRDAAGDPDPELVAQMIAWMVERVCHQTISRGAGPGDDAVAAALAESIWRIIEPGGGASAAR